MAGKRRSAERIIRLLRSAEMMPTEGKTTLENTQHSPGKSDMTCYHLRKEYGGMRIDQAKRMQEPEKGNVQLKRLVADLSLDNQLLRESPSVVPECGAALRARASDASKAWHIGAACMSGIGSASVSSSP